MLLDGLYTVLNANETEANVLLSDENHPVFKGFNASQGIFTNDIYKYRPLSLLTECAWEGIQPSGTVIALQEDDANIRNQNYASIVEYRFGKGKVLVFAGLSVNIIPGWGMAIPDVNKRAYRFETQERMKKLTWNAIEYLAQPTVFKRDKNSEITKQRTKSLGFYLPMEGWLFKTDPQRKGTQKKWYETNYDASGWSSIKIGDNWESQGFPDYNGYAWYRRNIIVSNKPGKKTILYFGAVDSEATVYLDGKLVGIRADNGKSWNKPFWFDITDMLTDQSKEHLLAVEVNDVVYFGGIYKPVKIQYKDE